MAKNRYGFVISRYRQPIRYREIFLMWKAIYRSKSGTEYHLQARPHFLNSNWEGAEIDHYEILRQDPDCRRRVCPDKKSMKAAFEVLERLLEK